MFEWGRVQGAMFGLACGDALGAPVEFLSQEQAQAKYGYVTEMNGGGIWEPGEWTDDTAMMLDVAEGLIDSHRIDDFVNLSAGNIHTQERVEPVSEITGRFLSWFDSRPKDVGNTIREALQIVKNIKGYEPPEFPNGIGKRALQEVLQKLEENKLRFAQASRGTSAALAGKAAGNGSLMRTLPIALGMRDTDLMAKHSARVSAITHWDAQAEVCCLVYNLWVRELAQATPRKDRVISLWETALIKAQHIALQGNLSPADTPGPAPLPPGFWERLQAVPSLQVHQLQPSGYSGYVLECLEAAAWWVMHTQSLEDCIVGCVNMAGEADTNAAVAGGAAGAFYGYAAIPPRWLSALHERDRIQKAAQDLHHLLAPQN